MPRRDPALDEASGEIAPFAGRHCGHLWLAELRQIDAESARPTQRSVSLQFRVTALYCLMGLDRRQSLPLTNRTLRRSP